MEGFGSVNNKGFTISKNFLTVAELRALKKDLSITPVSSFGNFENKEINVFEETKSSISVPLYYARASPILKKFKEVYEDKSETVEFPEDTISLRPGIQTDCYNECLKHKEEEVGGGILNLSVGSGKCLSFDTPVIMNDGSIKMVQDISQGDVLLGEEDSPCIVKSTTTGKDSLFKVSYEDGHFVCNSSHILCVKNQVKIIEIVEEREGFAISFFCPVNKAYSVQYCKTLRVALLTKNFLESIVGVVDISIDDYVTSKCKLPLYRRKEVKHWKSNGKSIEECYSLGASLEAKLIRHYVVGTEIERQAILDGILGTECILSEPLNKIVLFLGRSLGLSMKRTPYGSVKVVGKSKKTTIPFTISYLYYGDYYGFELTGNRRFVLGDFIVTHNTVLGIKLLTSFKLKSLIIVNKIQLMKQWTQELASKVPNVKIGTIQGKTFDIEGCQVVIGMVQTICLNKAITSDSFNCFGICLIDEAHGIASEVFSKIMFKIRPRYLFGLTATLERKDKMEKLLLWYIGPVLVSDESELKQISDIRVVKYNGESSREVLLRDGTPAVSTMISNISLDVERTDLLVGIIKDLAKNPKNQILVLGDRTAQLKNLNAKLSGISGLFIGTLKADALEIAKQRQVILATYGMAAEGFNVPRLNCLVFATPRSNISQSIGRIYRKQHDTPPIIIDIVDNFSIFSRQQYARRKIYKKNIKSLGSAKEIEECEEETGCLIEE